MKTWSNSCFIGSSSTWNSWLFGVFITSFSSLSLDNGSLEDDKFLSLVETLDDASDKSHMLWKLVPQVNKIVSRKPASLPFSSSDSLNCSQEFFQIWMIADQAFYGDKPILEFSNLLLLSGCYSLP